MYFCNCYLSSFCTDISYPVKADINKCLLLLLLLLVN